MARATKLTPELQERFCQIILQGNYRSVAASVVGIYPDTITVWMKKKRQPYTGFQRAVLKAEAHAQRAMVSVIIKAAADGDWRAAMEYLARKNPADWAKKDFQGMLGADGKPTDTPSGVLVVPGIMNEEAWAAAAARYKKIQPRAEEPAEDFDTIKAPAIIEHDGPAETVEPEEPPIDPRKAFRKL